MGDLSSKSKAELLAIIEDMKANSKQNRGDRMLELLREGYDSIGAIAEEMGIKTKNVSSIKNGLIKKGHLIISYNVGGSNVLALVEGDDDSIKVKGGSNE